MASVFTEIVDWVQTLPYWEQASFEKVYKGVECSGSEYNELAEYLLEDANLAEKPKTRPTLDYMKSVSTLYVEPKKVELKQIYDLENINALVENQKLTFGSNLTIIFGANGSGKSGYARVLGCAGFTRGDREILPDITQKYTETPPTCWGEGPSWK